MSAQKSRGTVNGVPFIWYGYSIWLKTQNNRYHLTGFRINLWKLVTLSKKNSKKFAKPIDKSLNQCYTIIVDKTNLKTLEDLKMIEIFENQTEQIEYYQNKKRVRFDRVDKNGTHIFIDSTCQRCGGEGWISCFGHIDGGRCFDCGGSGRNGNTEIKIYTDEYGAKLRAKREARYEAERQKKISEAGAKNAEWLKSEGFNAEGVTYVVLGDTYRIKEELKAHGAKYDYCLGWHLPEAAGYDAVPVKAEDITEADDIGRLGYINSTDIIELVENYKRFKENTLKELNGVHVSEYIGTVGERREFKCKLVGSFAYETHYSFYGEVSHIYKFEDENGDIIVWNTSSYLPDKVKENEECRFTATIKEHSEYRGEKQTVVNRPKFF